jgi:hypothetical protein
MGRYESIFAKFLKAGHFIYLNGYARKSEWKNVENNTSKSSIFLSQHRDKRLTYKFQFVPVFLSKT